MERSRAQRVFECTRLKYWVPAMVAADSLRLFPAIISRRSKPAQVIVPILRCFLAHASSTLIRDLHYGIRKLAQVIEFGVFSFTVFRALAAILAHLVVCWNANGAWPSERI